MHCIYLYANIYIFYIYIHKCIIYEYKKYLVPFKSIPSKQSEVMGDIVEEDIFVQQFVIYQGVYIHYYKDFLECY